MDILALDVLKDEVGMIWNAMNARSESMRIIIVVMRMYKWMYSPTICATDGGDSLKNK